MTDQTATLPGYALELLDAYIDRRIKDGSLTFGKTEDRPGQRGLVLAAVFDEFLTGAARKRSALNGQPTPLHLVDE